MKDPRVRLILLIALLDSVAANGLGALMTKYLVGLPNKPVLLTGGTALMLAIQLAMSPAVGSWSDKAGRRPAIIATTIASFASSLFLLPVVPWSYMVNRTAKGATNGLYAVLRSSMADVAEKETLITYSGILQFLVGAGAMIGPAVTGLMLLFFAEARLAVQPTVWLLLALSAINIGLAFRFRETNEEEREPVTFNEIARKGLDALKVKTLWDKLGKSDEKLPGLKPLFILSMLTTLGFGYYAFFIAFLTQSKLGMTVLETVHFFLYFAALALLSNWIFFRYIINRVNKRTALIVVIMVGIAVQVSYAFAEESKTLLYVAAAVDAVSVSLLGGLLGSVLSEVAKQGDDQGETFGGFQALGGVASFVAACANTLLSGVSMQAPFFFCVAASVAALWWLFRLPDEARHYVDRVGSVDEEEAADSQPQPAGA